MESALTVLIVDRDPSAGSELRAKLSIGAGIDVVAVACAIRDAIARIEEHAPHVVLVGDQRDGLRGIAILAALRRKQPGIRCVVVSDIIDLDMRVQCVEAGADALLRRTASAEEFQETLLAVVTGANLLQREAMGDLEMMQRLLEQVRRVTVGGRPANPFDPNLTPCLLGVLDGVVQGWSNHRISEAEGIAEQTVKHHIANLKLRLGVRDRIGLVRHAVRREWARLQPAPDRAELEATGRDGRDDFRSQAVIRQLPNVRQSPGVVKVICVSGERADIYHHARRV